MGRLWACAALVLVLVAPARAAEPPDLGARAFTLSADPAAHYVDVAVDASGTGHFAWDYEAAGGIGPDPLMYCRVPRGATACQGQQSFALPHSAFGHPQVLTPGNGVVVLLAYRCCGSDEGTYAVVSTDGGATFAAPVLVSSVQVAQAAFGPGSLISVVDDVVTLGIHYQAVSAGGPPPASSAHVGDGQSQSYDGSVAFTAPNVPIVAFDDLQNGFFREWGGSGDVNDLATWKSTQPLGPLTELRLASGPKGTVLVGKQTTGASDTYVARRFDTAADGFGPAVALSDPSAETHVKFRDIFEDAGGNVAAVWLGNGSQIGRIDPLRYRVSTDGGSTWQPERTLLASTDNGAFDINMGAAPDGGGFVAYDNNGRGPIAAAPIPPIAQQGLAAPVAGKTMSSSVVSGTVRVRLPGTNTFVALTGSQQLPVGTVVDTTHGVVALTAAGTGQTYKGQFSRGVFKIGQKAHKRYRGKLTADLTLTGPALGCKAGKADADVARRRTVRFLQAKAHGRFKTIGRNSATVERGTTWTVKDTCAGTTTHVISGRVWILDFARRKTIPLKAGQTYRATGSRG